MRRVVVAAGFFAMGCGTVLAISDDAATDATHTTDAGADTGSADAAANCMVKATPCAGPHGADAEQVRRPQPQRLGIVVDAAPSSMEPTSYPRSTA